MYDLIVIGAGSAGIACAYTAARHGLHTILIEKKSFAGGTLTASLVSPMLSFHSGRRQILFGFAEMLVRRLKERGGSLGHLPDPLDFAPSLTPVDSEQLKQTEENLCREAGVELLYHTLLVRVETDKGKPFQRITAVQVQTLEGEKQLTARYFVDATGDGVLSAKAGTLFSVGGRRRDIQPMSLLFTMQDVEVEALTHYQKRNPKEFVLRKDFEKIVYPNTKIVYPAVCGFFSKIRQAKKQGDFPLPRDRVLLFGGVRLSEVVVNMTRVSASPLNPIERSRAEMEGRKQVDQCVTFLKEYLPGFQQATVGKIAAEIGVRESRRIRGLYQLTENDILRCKTFQDGVVRCAYPIDIHQSTSASLLTKRLPRGRFYEIPLRCLIVKGFLNLGVAGRCASFTHTALSSARVSAQCFGMGEAIGIAVAEACRRKCALPRIPFSIVKERLLQAEKKFEAYSLPL